MFEPHIIQILACLAYGLSVSVLFWETDGQKLFNLAFCITTVILSFVLVDTMWSFNPEWLSLALPPATIVAGVCFAAFFGIDVEEWQKPLSIVASVLMGISILLTIAG